MLFMEMNVKVGILLILLIYPNLDGYVCNTLTMDDRLLQGLGLIHNIDDSSSLSELL